MLFYIFFILSVDHRDLNFLTHSVPTRRSSDLDMEHEADVNDSDVFFNLHSGTHVDAPSHFVRGGRTADDLSLNTLIGKAYVVEVPPQVDCIDKIGRASCRERVCQYV